MPDIHHRLAITAPIDAVFQAISTQEGLNAWWTKDCEGTPTLGAPYRFFFSEQYDWSGSVSAIEAGRMIEWTFLDAEPDWTGTRLRIELTSDGDRTWVAFLHADWSEVSDHFCHTSFCWASYLRLLRRWVEEGFTLPYEERGED